MIVAEMPSPATSFPFLASLALGKEHLAALARQGHLHAEGSGQGKRYYKLRFRTGSAQHVRYVGSNPAFVEQVQRELMDLQARSQSRRELAHLIRAARACLRKTKQQLAPLLPLTGRGFHGREIRRQPRRHAAGVDGNETLRKTSFRRKVMDDRHEFGEETAAAKPTPNSAAVNVPKSAERRRQRLQELYAAACEKDDPLQASICSATADLLEIGHQLSTVIKTELGARPNDLRGIGAAMPAINVLTLVHRQACRFVQFDRDWAAEQGSEPGAKRRNKTGEMGS